MAKPIIHARSCARRYGGTPEEHLVVHQLMDRSKGAAGGSNLHRALTHHGEFLWLLERIVGVTFTAGGREIATRDCGERHCQEDHGGIIPVASDYWRALSVTPWMLRGAGAETVAGHRDRTVRALGGPPAEHEQVHRLLEYARPGVPVGAHRGLTHHAFGVWLLEQALGETLTDAETPVREICRLHIEHDLGRDVPDAGEWLERLTFAAWMNGGASDRPPSAGPVIRHRTQLRARDAARYRPDTD